jgi:hypothetical protein
MTGFIDLDDKGWILAHGMHTTTLFLLAAMTGSSVTSRARQLDTTTTSRQGLLILKRQVGS